MMCAYGPKESGQLPIITKHFRLYSIYLHIRVLESGHPSNELDTLVLSLLLVTLQIHAIRDTRSNISSR